MALVRWRHAFGDTTPDVLVAFAGGPPFDIAGVPIAEDVALVDLGLDLDLDLDLTANAALALAYGGQFGSGFTDQSLMETLNIRF